MGLRVPRIEAPSGAWKVTGWKVMEVPLFATEKMSPSKAHLSWKVIDGR